MTRLTLLKAIRRAEPVARTQLVEMTGLAAGTVSELTGRMVRKGLLLEEKAPVVTTGRARVELRLNPDAAYVVGALLVPRGTLEIVIANLRGEVIFSRSPEVLFSGLDTLAARLADIIGLAIDESPLTKSEITRIAIGLPAVVDNAHGTLLWLQTFPRGEISIADVVEARLGVPTSIDNNASIVARAEHWFGDGGPHDDFCLVMLGYGLGFAEYRNGLLWTTAGGLNPELGHTKIVHEAGRPCPCGATGCLATYCTIYAIVAEICACRNVAPPPFLDVQDAYAAAVADACNGEPVPSAAFACAGSMLGLAMANYVNVSDPKRMIIMCMREGLIELVAPAFHRAFEANVLPVLAGRAQVEFRLASEERFAKGSAALALEDLYRVK
ncbi:ROK family transcriptional regulator [Novosphingobium sp.]|uniref:ROK family transcriptional regulator n=1 Tax=Novosphingobium sp. TaxID=1874826 RepID=UPI0025F193AE|nr:ROK family transcriptional regulator [Novosphingobium sp.]